MHGVFIIPLGGPRGGRKTTRSFRGSVLAKPITATPCISSKRNALHIINATHCTSFTRNVVQLQRRNTNSQKHRDSSSSPPSGDGEGEERPQGLSGGVGGVLGSGEKYRKGLQNFMQDLNQTTRLKAKAFRREFATRSQSSPLFALFERAGWRVFKTDGRKKAKQKPRGDASRLLFWLLLLDLNQRHPD